MGAPCATTHSRGNRVAHRTVGAKKPSDTKWLLLKKGHFLNAHCSLCALSENQRWSSDEIDARLSFAPRESERHRERHKNRETYRERSVDKRKRDHHIKERDVKRGHVSIFLSTCCLSTLCLAFYVFLSQCIYVKECLLRRV